MEWVYDDGGRSQYFKGKNAGDCAFSVIAIATGKDYMEVYNDINVLAKDERITKRRPTRSSARNGVYIETLKKLMASYGWKWVATTEIGTGCKVHLRADELPSGNIVARVSNHMTAVIDGVCHDLYDPSREGTRCVYGYFIKEA